MGFTDTDNHNDIDYGNYADRAALDSAIFSAVAGDGDASNNAVTTREKLGVWLYDGNSIPNPDANKEPTCTRE